MLKSINLISVSPEELAELISKEINKTFQNSSNNQIEQLSEYLTPDETADLLKVTKPTIWRYRKRGKITPYYFENKVYYKRSEIEQGFTKMEK